jgi:hypothetical protein
MVTVLIVGIVLGFIIGYRAHRAFMIWRYQDTVTVPAEYVERRH